MKDVSIHKIIHVALSYARLKTLSNFATSKAGKDVRVVTDKGNQCYSYDDYYTGFNIVLGKKFYPSSFQDSSDVPYVDLKSKYYTVASVMFGAYYHELFHVLYTPFKYSSELTRRCGASFAEFTHTICNILEDVTIEGTGINRFPYSEPYIEAVRQCFLLPEQMELLTDAVATEPTNPGTMTAYLLHFCRETPNLPTYKLFEDNKEFIKWGAYKCINTIDPYLRTRRQVSFALELCKILNMKEPSKDNMEDPNLNDLDSESSSYPISSSSGKGSKAIEPLKNNLSDTSSQGVNNKGHVSDTDEDVKQDGPKKEMKASRDGTSSESPTNADLTKAGITMLANDDPVSNYTHMTDRLDKYVNTKAYLPKYQALVHDQDKLIRNVVAIIRKMIAQNNSGWSRYKMSGQFDVTTACKKDNYKFFKKQNAPAPTADLVFEILVDNSGSMYGTKAKLAGRALITFCEALDRLHIPFSVDAFTETRYPITISLKEYDETYQKVKTNMTLFTEQFDCGRLGTWSGNIDEVNLKYVSDELSLRKEKDKVIIVISDGATCGSYKELQKLADNISSRGITVLGVGIMDSNAENIYKNHIILKTKDDLEKLGGFLNKYLIGKIFK